MSTSRSEPRPSNLKVPQQGGCACSEVRYEVDSAPMFVHCCHCTWCQRETGSAFALNALIEVDRVRVLNGKLEASVIPSESGAGQKILRCRSCRTAVWSHYDYASTGEAVAFLRGGTLDDLGAFPPDVHIFTRSKVPWVILPEGVLTVPVYYRSSEVWPEASLARRRLLIRAD